MACSTGRVPSAFHLQHIERQYVRLFPVVRMIKDLIPGRRFAWGRRHANVNSLPAEHRAGDGDVRLSTRLCGFQNGVAAYIELLENGTY